jgi:diacylglycerol kinase family enzyme
LDHQGEGPKPTLAILPIGSGNDLAWNIGINSDLETACRRLFAGQQKLIDTGLIRDNQGHSRRFCNGVGIGFDGTIAREVQKVQWVGGFTKYLVGIARTFVLHYNAPFGTLDFDGEEIAQDVMMLSICNGRRLGGGFLIAPEAIVDDGYFDICLVPRVGRLTILEMIPRFLRGTHVHDPRVRMDRGQQIGVDLEEGLAVHLDGEIFSDSAHSLQIEILPRSLGVLV